MAELSCTLDSGNITTVGQPGLDLDGCPRENLGISDDLIVGMARSRPVFRTPFIERVEEISDEMVSDHQSCNGDDLDQNEDTSDEDEGGEIPIYPRDRFDEMWDEEEDTYNFDSSYGDEDEDYDSWHDEDEDYDSWHDEDEDYDSWHDDHDYDPTDFEPDEQEALVADLFDKRASQERSDRIRNIRDRGHSRARGSQRITIKARKAEIETVTDEQIGAWKADRRILKRGSKMFWSNPDIKSHFSIINWRVETVVERHRQGLEFSLKDYAFWKTLTRVQRESAVYRRSYEGSYGCSSREHWTRRRATCWKYRKGSKAQWDRCGTQRKQKKSQDPDEWIDLGFSIVPLKDVRAVSMCLVKTGRIAPELYDRMIEEHGCGTVIEILKYLGIEENVAYEMEHRHYEMAAK